MIHLVKPTRTRDIVCLYYSGNEVVRMTLPEPLKANRTDWQVWIEEEPGNIHIITSKLPHGDFVYPDTEAYDARICDHHSVVLLNKDGVPVDEIPLHNIQAELNGSILTLTAKRRFHSIVPKDISKITHVSANEVGNQFITCTVHGSKTYVETDNMYTVYKMMDTLKCGNSIDITFDLRFRDRLIVVACWCGIVLSHSRFAVVHCCELDKFLPLLAGLESTSYRYVHCGTVSITIALQLSEALASTVAELPSTSIVKLLLEEPFPEMYQLLNTIATEGGMQDTWLLEALPCPCDLKQYIRTTLAVRWASE